MEMFKIVLGSTQVELSVTLENNRYVGRINNIILYESFDYEAVREAMTNGVGGEKPAHMFH